MAVTTNGGHNRSYACKCLNVRINTRSPPSSAEPAEKDYTSVYVGDDGISAHNQLTLRTRSRAKEQKRGDETVLTRYMSLTCLICRTLVYRVLQVITPDVDCGEGPVPPTEDWAECELLKSPSGWIEVYKDCISDDDIARAEASPLYSRTFCIVLPSGGSSSSAAPSYSAPSQSKISFEQRTHLPPLPPLFLPPPFTPSHTVFRHISSIATEISTKLREEAEEYLAKVVQDKLQELQLAESKLKQEVETIWLQWRHALTQIEQEFKEKKKRSRSRTRQSSANFYRPTSPNIQELPASIRITNFVPPQSPIHRSLSSVASPPGMSSALSASLATSSFHHPRAQAERNGAAPAVITNGARTSPPVYSPRVASPEPETETSTRDRSPATASSRTLALNIQNEAGSIREAYRRNMDESKDIATSFKYVLDMAEQMDEMRGGKPLHIVKETEPIPQNVAPSVVGSQPRGRSPRTSKSAMKHSHDNDASTSTTTKQEKKNGEKPAEKAVEQNHDVKLDSRDKGKRKVTFVVSPDVTIIDGEASKEMKAETPGEEEAAIFDFESEAGDRGSIVDPLSHRNSEPTSPVDAIQAPQRPRRVRQTDASGLPSSLSTLRPASLPQPSAIRPPSSSAKDVDQKPKPDEVDELVLANQYLAKTIGTVEESPPEDFLEDDIDSREAEILRLVAAHTPSHRNAWKKNSKAWQLFVSRQGKKKKDSGRIAEEDEEDSTSSRAGYYDSTEDEASTEDDTRNDPHFQLATSAPIPIAPIGRGRHFGMQSYQPKTSLSDRPGVLVPALRKNSSAALKASYAERDRFRSIDPGIVDFADEDEDDEEDEDDVRNGEDVGGRARQRALKILQARDSVPAAGMWRSLAS
ncbi:unnamed protein product [Somion occarium]|uniref:Uncharacterized protein n=1 Tax=Somion occarium TaxID=3059160 RepID=A0ABP1D3P6_9APHY